MSRVGKKRETPLGVGPNGRKWCAWCQVKEVGKGRRRYCSKACAEMYAISRNSAFARQRVYERDQGVCAVCGFDALAMAKRVGAVLKSTNERHPVQLYRDIANEFHALGFHRVRTFSPLRVDDLWDMDHVVPVIEGGGGCQLENLRTLCCPCHKQVTADLRARLSKKGPKQRQATLFTALSQGRLSAGDELTKLLGKVQADARA